MEFDWRVNIMMTSMSSVGNASAELYQMAQSMQPKANEKSAAELKAEEQQAENAATSKVSPKVSVDEYSELRMAHIRRAAEVGILRPVWLETIETLDANPDMPRTRDLIQNIMGKDGKSEHAAAERVIGGTESTDKSERVMGGTGSADKSERVMGGTEGAGKSEYAAGGTESTGKSERVANGTEGTANLLGNH